MNDKPRPWMVKYGPFNVVLFPDLLTDSGNKIRNRFIMSVIIFVLCFIMSAGTIILLG
jgi:hypothetical protein